MCELILDAPALITIEGEILEACRYQDGTGYALVIQTVEKRWYIGPAPSNLGWRSLTRLIGRRAHLEAIVAAENVRYGFRIPYSNPVNFYIIGYKKPPDKRKIIQ
jgi:hypothetical protein